MKNYIKAGFGVTIGIALADLAIKAFNEIFKGVAKGMEKDENEETESEEKSDE